MSVQTQSSVTLDAYPLGRTSPEYQRLRLQAKMWEPTTQRVLQEIGLCAGMRCLDVGCGPGEVMRLMGEMAGPAGQVTGIDLDGRLGREALDVLSATTNSRFKFIEANVEAIEAVPGQLFDIVYGRLILLYVHDLRALLRKLYAWTKPGGYIILQEYDMRPVDIFPTRQAADELARVILGTFEQSGCDIGLGSKLATCFVEAGLGHPDGTDVTGIVAPLEQMSGQLLGVYRSLLPRALQLGITSEVRSQVFLDEFDKMLNEPASYALMPLLISAWKRKPA